MDVSLSRHVERLTRNDLDLDSSNWNFYYIYMGYSVASLKFGDNYAILSSIPRRIWPEDTTSVSIIENNIIQSCICPSLVCVH